MTDKSLLKIFIGTDHRGFLLKAKLIEWLQTQGYQVIDNGNTELDLEDDYPDFSIAVAEAVAREAGNARGIILCGSGVGATIAANKVPGALASLGLSPEMVENGRHDDNFNVLVIAADFQDLETAQELITAFLETPYEGGGRYQRRLDKITAYEQSH